MEKIESFEDACKAEDLNPETVIPDFSCYPEKDRKSMVAHAKLVIIVRAVNRLANGGAEWIPDFDNVSQDKYEIWFRKGGSSGFRFNDCDYWYSASVVGSRLCFISREIAEETAEQFIDLYNEYLL